MQAAGPSADDRPKQPKRMTAYLLFQQVARADMYAKFGGKDAFNANLQERHQCHSTEVNEDGNSTGNVNLMVLWVLWVLSVLPPSRA